MAVHQKEMASDDLVPLGSWKPSRERAGNDRSEGWTQTSLSAGTHSMARYKPGKLLTLIHFNLIQPKKKRKGGNIGECWAQRPSWDFLSGRGVYTLPIDTDCHNGYTTVQQGHRREGVCLRRWHLRGSWMAEEVPIGWGVVGAKIRSGKVLKTPALFPNCNKPS